MAFVPMAALADYENAKGSRVWCPVKYGICNAVAHRHYMLQNTHHKADLVQTEISHYAWKVNLYRSTHALHSVNVLFPGLYPYTKMAKMCHNPILM